MALCKSQRIGRVLAIGCAIVCCAHAQQAANPNRGNNTRTQSIQPCETPTNAPGGSIGRSSGNTNNQSPFQRPTMIPNGRYDVFSQAQTGTGDRKAGSAAVQRNGPSSIQVRTPSGAATLTFQCVEKDIIYYSYGSKRVGFVKVFNPTPNSPPTYDVHWFGSTQNEPHAVETWQYIGQ